MRPDAMRAIHPDVVELLPKAFDVLTSAAGRGVTASRTQQEEGRKQVEAIGAAGGEHADVVREFCKRLFPLTRAYIDNMHFGAESQRRWRKDRRVAHPDVLRICLEKRLPAGVPTTSFVRKVFESLGDRHGLVHLLESLNSTELELILERLLDFEDEYPAESIEVAIEGLAGSLERLREGHLGFFDPFGAERVLGSLTLRLLRRAGGSAVALALVESVVPRLPTLSSKRELLSQIGKDDHEASGEFGTPADKSSY